MAKEFHGVPSGRDDQGRPAPERAVHDEDPARPAVERPARRLPAVGRRRARRPGEGRQGRRHDEVRLAVDQEHRRRRRRLAGRAASSTAIPYSLGVVGFWYNKDLFAKAGITSPPKTWPQFIADVTKLKTAGITPIAIGSKDRWPDAFYWDYFATKLCSKATMQQSAVTYNFKDPCWLKAGQLHAAAARRASRSRTASSPRPLSRARRARPGLLANGKAAMELQGHWNPGVMQPLTPDNKIPSFLGWFPFPNVPGSKAIPGSLLGGGDGFACSWKAPEPACAQFLEYIDSPSVQRRIGTHELRPAGAEGHGELGEGSEPEDGAAGSARARRSSSSTSTSRTRQRSARRSTTRSRTSSPARRPRQQVVDADRGAAKQK